jgi:hypothetical protein
MHRCGKVAFTSQQASNTETTQPATAGPFLTGNAALMKLISKGVTCRYLLQPPAPRGSPFIITNKTITELHLALARRAGHYKVGIHLPCTL